MNKEYYSNNANNFFKDTVNVDMSDIYQRFTKSLAKGSIILDAGCGSGRDIKAFMDMGYDVEAIDASVEMVNLASEYSGIKVQHKYFDEVDNVEYYDGIWCCASLLHVKRKDLPNVIKILSKALKDHGVLYLSFKYGYSEREKDGRHFTDMTEDLLESLLSDFTDLKIQERWLTDDARPNRDDKWLNTILRKN